MLKAVIREYMGASEKAKQVIKLDGKQNPITIGRGAKCSCKIGSGLGDWGGGISRVQCTIEISDNIVLIDGTREDGYSSNRVWFNDLQLDEPLVLEPDMDITLFKRGIAKVSMLVTDGVTPISNGHETYTGDELLSVMQEQMVILQEQVGILQDQNNGVSEQVILLSKQLAQREAIDRHQTETIDVLKKQIKRVVGGVLVFAAIVILGFGLSKDISSDERKEWRSLLGSVVKELLLAGALGGSALYLNKEEKPKTAAGEPPTKTKS